MEDLEEKKDTVLPEQKGKRSLIGKVIQTWASHAGIILSYTLMVVTPVICFLMVELLAESNPFTKLQLWQWALNLVWYYFLLFAGWMITGRRKGAMLFDVFVSFALGLVNHYVLTFRGRALFPIDILSWKTAANVAKGYDFTPDRFVWGALGILAAMLLIAFFLPKQKERAKGRKVTIFRLAVSAGWIVYIILFFFTGMLQTLEIYAQQWKTQGNGFLLNFTVSAHYMLPEKPDGYSEEDLEELISDLEDEGCVSDCAADCDAEAVNFIVVMDESFADLTQYTSLTLSGDPIPFYHSLKENTIKGTMISPVTGGGTAAVEFEVLTGNTMAFLPEGTVAYQLYVTESTPSLARLGSALGASTAAYHPYQSSGWNRTTAYGLLGFASQYYEDRVLNGTAFDCSYGEDEIVREYVSDSADFSRLYALTDEAKEQGTGCFLFNVTMQNHSGYNKEWTNLEEGVVLAGDYAGQSYENSTNQYLALISETDRALEELITHYSSVEEKTVILFFGDHQPPLSNDLFEDIFGKELDDRTDEEVLEQYEVPFFIWANYDIEEQEDLVIGSSYLGVLASNIAGYPQTGYMKFLSEMNEVFAAVTPVNYVLQDGRVVPDSSQLSEEEQGWLQDYAWLQYYNLFGGEQENDFFFLPESK